MSIQENLDEFIKVFSGHPETYNYGTYPIVRDENKTGAKVSNDSIHFAENTTVVPSLYDKHLNGIQFLGIAPIDDENKTTFGVLDIDIYGQELNNVVRFVYENELPLVPFRTKSGGLHLYVFTRAAVQAKSMIDCLKDLDDTLGLSANFPKKVEIFPKQAKLAAGQNPSPITLPYFNAANPSAYIIDTKLREVKFDNAMKIIKRTRCTLQDISDKLKELPFNDAPKCIQTMRNMAWIRENGGRNKYLYTVCVYLKKKFGGAENAVVEELQDFNNAMYEPVDDEELSTIYNSVMSHEYNYKCQDEPCKTFCNAAKCRLRQFGVGKDKNAVFTGLDYGKMYRYMTADPYYEWELKLPDDEAFKRIKFNDEYELLDQRKFATLVMRYCNVAPAQIDDNNWRKTITLYLTDITEIEVGESGDTSETAVLREEFKRYLATVRAMSPVQIKIGLVVFEKGKYYFLFRGFQDFLDKKKLRKVGVNLRALLLRFGAVEGELKYKNRNGIEATVPCWVKESDDEIKGSEEYYEDVIKAQDAIIEASAAEQGHEEKEEYTQDGEGQF